MSRSSVAMETRTDFRIVQAYPANVFIFTIRLISNISGLTRRNFPCHFNSGQNRFVTEKKKKSFLMNMSDDDGYTATNGGPYSLVTVLYFLHQSIYLFTHNTVSRTWSIPSRIHSSIRPVIQPVVQKLLPLPIDPSVSPPSSISSSIRSIIHLRELIGGTKR